MQSCLQMWKVKPRWENAHIFWLCEDMQRIVAREERLNAGEQHSGKWHARRIKHDKQVEIAEGAIFNCVRPANNAVGCKDRSKKYYAAQKNCKETKKNRASLHLENTMQSKCAITEWLCHSLEERRGSKGRGGSLRSGFATPLRRTKSVRDHDTKHAQSALHTETRRSRVKSRLQTSQI